MIHQHPRFYVGGDRYIEVELGDGMSFELNILVHNLVAAIRQAAIPGIIELIPELASMQISYDPEVIRYADVVREVGALHDGASRIDAAELPSRMFYIPVMYFDPWTEACIEDYRSRQPDKQPDAQLVCQANGLPGRDALRRLHAGTDYWVAALGFWPGLCSLMPLDDRARIVAPKYNPPRTWTPRGAVGLGGALTCIYPDRTPGGYQLLGRTPVPTFDREQRLPAFHDDIVLFRPGDRVRFIPIDQAEFEFLESEVEAGRYEHHCVEHQTFSVGRYREARRRLEAGQPAGGSA